MITLSSLPGVRSFAQIKMNLQEDVPEVVELLKNGGGEKLKRCYERSKNATQ